MTREPENISNQFPLKELQTIAISFTVLCLSGWYIFFCPWSLFLVSFHVSYFFKTLNEKCAAVKTECHFFFCSREGLETSSGTVQTISGQLPKFEETRLSGNIKSPCNRSA